MNIAYILFFVTLLATPYVSFASVSYAGETIIIQEVQEENVYALGADIRITGELLQDMVSAAGTITLLAPVKGDALMIGGTIATEAPIDGDVRIIGGKTILGNTISGDILLFSGVATALQALPEARIFAGKVDITQGATGPVTIFAGSATLSGTFSDNVTVSVSDKLTILPGTTIEGSLKYNAPEQVLIPDSATVLGEVSYTGTSSFIPSPEEAKTVAIAGAGVFILIKIVSMMILAGLFAGLFGAYTNHIISASLYRGPRRILLLALLGFAVLVATPVLIVLLIMSFVGISVALLLGIIYALFFMLAHVFAGIALGAIIGRYVLKRTHVSWRAAALGSLVLGLIGTLPFVGSLLTLFLMVISGGALLSTSYIFAFPKREEVL